MGEDNVFDMNNASIEGLMSKAGGLLEKAGDFAANLMQALQQSVASGITPAITSSQAGQAAASTGQAAATQLGNSIA